MINNIKNWLLQKYNLPEKDIFETAKIKLIANFAIYYLILGFCSIILSIATGDICAMIITTLFFLINLLAVTSIRFYHNVDLSAKFLSINMIVGLIIIIVNNHLIVDIVHLSHAMIAILFSHFTLGRKWSIYLASLFCVFICATMSVFQHYYISNISFLFNPTFKIEYLNLFSPIITFINVLIIIRLLDFQRRNQLEALKTVERSNKLKTGILGVVAHDLRGPIANIVVVNEFLKSNLKAPEKDDGESIEYTGMIDDMCQRSLSIIHDLVDVAELESQDFTLDLESQELNGFVAKSFDELKFKASKKDITLNFIPFHEKIFVEINTDKFSRVIENLVTNAIKFTNSNGEIVLTITLTQNHVLLKLDDNGIGIPARMQKVVFDKFTTASRRGTNGEKSLGIGLSITKRIIELHDGKIWFTSQEGSGTSFFVQLPK